MSLYEQAFRDAFSTHADEAPALPPLPELPDPSELELRLGPRRAHGFWGRGPRATRRWVALAAAIMMVVGLGWLAIRGPSNSPSPAVTVASPAPTREPSSQVAFPSTATRSPSPNSVPELCEVPLPQQWKSMLQAGEVPKDPREPTSGAKGRGWPVAYGEDRYAYVASFTTEEHATGVVGMVSEVVNGQRTDLLPLTAESQAGVTKGAYLGTDLYLQLDYNFQAGALLRYRRSTGTFEVIVKKTASLMRPFVVLNNKVAWLQVTDLDRSRARLHQYDPETGVTTSGPEVSANALVSWQGILLTYQWEQDADRPAFTAFDVELKPTVLPEPIKSLRGPVLGAASDGITLAWTASLNDRNMYWVRPGMSGPVIWAHRPGGTQDWAVSSVSGPLLSVQTSQESVIVDTRAGSWTTAAYGAEAYDGHLDVGGEPVWGGSFGVWTTKISDLDPLPQCQR